MLLCGHTGSDCIVIIIMLPVSLHTCCDVIVGVTALSYDEDIHDSLLKHISYMPTCLHIHAHPNNPTAYTPVTRVAIVGVTALP